MELAQFDTKSVHMARVLIVDTYAPRQDVDRIMEHVCGVDPLAQGLKYDSNAYQSADGVERYRPRQGAAAGAEEEVRKRPGIVCISFELPDDQDVLARVVEAIFQVHAYQEPVIRAHHILSSRSRGLNDRDNPNRWWNTSGDWMKGGA